MKIKKQEKKEIIAGIIELLIPAKNEILIKRFGRTLIERGVLKDNDGNPVQPGKMYVVKELEDINHESELSQRIDKAKSINEMQVSLAKYLAQYGRRPERNLKVIINPLKTRLLK